MILVGVGVFSVILIVLCDGDEKMICLLSFLMVVKVFLMRFGLWVLRFMLVFVGYVLIIWLNCGIVVFELLM